MIGQTLAHYHILEKLGEGGMGVVYKARDTHLDRLVAIKVLPHDRTADPERKRRFIQEARSASGLSHPNIVTVHDVASDAGVDFIAMECVSGRTLGEVIGRKGLKLRDVLNYGAQIADALAAAHGAGIVHRDVKPGNVMVTDRGLVKVLDFGLAKLTEPAVDENAPTVTRLPKTEEGLVAGTAAYMSPEQAEGKPVDARSDIFSFGAVLYEMATGRRAFSGQTTVSTLSAILHQEPAPLEEASPELERIIARCLRKDPDRRIQHMVDVKIALEDLKEESDSGKLPSVAIRPAVRVNRWATAAPAVAVLGLLLAVGAVLWLWPRGGSDVPASELKPIKLTANPSEYPISGASLAPDGKFLAYSDPRGIHLRLMATSETESLPETEGMIVAGWSADGAKVIAWRQAGGEAASYWSISIIGSGTRRPTTRGVPAPDGSSTLFVEGSELWVEGREGRRQLGTVLTTQDSRGVPERFVWSRDSQRIVFLRRLPPTRDGQNELVAFDVATGREDIVAPAEQLPRFIQAIAWAGDNRIIFAAPEVLPDSTPNDQSDTNLWDLRLDPKAAARRLTNWSQFHIAAFSVTPDGKTLSFLETKYQEDVWVAGLEAGNRRLVNPRRLTFDERNDRPLSWTADGRSVIFVSNRSGTSDVFLQDLDRDVAVMVAGGPGYQAVGRSTGDGRWILYIDGPARRLMRVARPGAVPVEIGSFPDLINFRCGSMPSSSCIAERGGVLQPGSVHLLDPVAGLGRLLFRTPADSGSPAPSPAVDRFAYILPPEPGRPTNRIRIVAADGTVEREISAASATTLNSLDYSADGRGLFTSDYSTDLGAWLLYVSLDGDVTILWNNRGSVRTWGVPSPDGQWIALLGATQESNVWVLEGF